MWYAVLQIGSQVKNSNPRFGKNEKIYPITRTLQNKPTKWIKNMLFLIPSLNTSSTNQINPINTAINSTSKGSGAVCESENPLLRPATIAIRKEIK
ncbi:MAG: hypothetical protein JWQ27_387 [Ferruginibacter sp.]|nr:hypothetical protein [Ferruginibacter sp.]